MKHYTSNASGLNFGDKRRAYIGVEPFLFAPSLGRIRLGVHQGYAEHGAGPAQLVVSIRSPVIDIVPMSA